MLRRKKYIVWDMEHGPVGPMTMKQAQNFLDEANVKVPGIIETDLSIWEMLNPKPQQAQIQKGI